MSLETTLLGTRKLADVEQQFDDQSWEIQFNFRSMQFQVAGKKAIQVSTCKPKDRQYWPTCYIGGLYSDAQVRRPAVNSPRHGKIIPTYELAEFTVRKINEELLAMESVLADMSEFDIAKLFLVLWSKSLGFWTFIPHPIEELREVVPRYHQPPARKPKNKTPNKHSVANKVADQEGKKDNGHSERHISPPVTRPRQEQTNPIDKDFNEVPAEIRGDFNGPLGQMLDRWMGQTSKKEKNKEEKPEQKPARYAGQVSTDFAKAISQQVFAKYGVKLACLTVSESNDDVSEQSIWIPGELDKGMIRKVAGFVGRRVKKYGQPLLPEEKKPPKEKQAPQKQAPQKQAPQKQAKTLPGKAPDGKSKGRRAKIVMPKVVKCKCGCEWEPQIIESKMPNSRIQKVICCPQCYQTYNLVDYEFWNLFGEQIQAMNRNKTKDNPVIIGDWIYSLAYQQNFARLDCKY